MRQYLSQSHGSQDIPESGGCQQPGGPAVVVHVGHGVDGVLHLEVHDAVDKNGYRVLRENLKVIRK